MNSELGKLMQNKKLENRKKHPGSSFSEISASVSLDGRGHSQLQACQMSRQMQYPGLVASAGKTAISMENELPSPFPRIDAVMQSLVLLA